ncbi:hypothetical protein FACS1894218_2890 [Bacilli bacterium]|nr:hypothetical protein FACS1894218_2890 [Bacilli bacterium]
MFLVTFLYFYEEKAYNVLHRRKIKMAKRKLNPALSRPLTPSATLAAIVGTKALARSAAIKKT